jgi:hypothetical protein
MTFTVVILIGLTALALNVLIRWVLRRSEPLHDTRDVTTVQRIIHDRDELANIWSHRAESGTPWRIPDDFLPLHPDIKTMMERYESICFGRSTIGFSRQLVRHFEDNAEFVVLGDAGDGSPTMARRSKDDGRIYIASIEDYTGAPQVLAASLAEYLVKMEREYPLLRMT